MTCLSKTKSARSDNKLHTANFVFAQHQPHHSGVYALIYRSCLDNAWSPLLGCRRRIVQP
ncbi:hypothetical protein M3J09_002685 [Ascochyta lentis]